MVIKEVAVWLLLIISLIHRQRDRQNRDSDILLIFADEVVTLTFDFRAMVRIMFYVRPHVYRLHRIGSHHTRLLYGTPFVTLLISIQLSPPPLRIFCFNHLFHLRAMGRIMDFHLYSMERHLAHYTSIITVLDSGSDVVDDSDVFFCRIFCFVRRGAGMSFCVERCTFQPFICLYL
jgi:hypothetical protein